MGRKNANSNVKESTKQSSSSTKNAPKEEERSKILTSDNDDKASTVPTPPNEDKKKIKAKKSSSIFSVSCGASIFVILYLLLAMMNLYGLMYPLARLQAQINQQQEQQVKQNWVSSWWKPESTLYTHVFLSTQSKLGPNLFSPPSDTNDAILLWQADSLRDSSSIEQSFILCQQQKQQDIENCTGHAEAKEFLLKRFADAAGGVMASAGEGIESTSILLWIYNSISDALEKLFQTVGLSSSNDYDQQQQNDEQGQNIITKTLPPKLWKALHSNSTLHLHVIVTKSPLSKTTTSTTTMEEQQVIWHSLRTLYSKTHSALWDQVDCIKYDKPHHISKPKRRLIYDLVYWFQLLVPSGEQVPIKPWDFALSQPDNHKVYQQAQDMIQNKEGYPYWKPEVSIKYIYESQPYPLEYSHVSGMSLVRVPASNQHSSGVAMMPALYVDEIGLTSEKYIPMNATVTALPLRVSLDRNDIDKTTTKQKRKLTATAGAVTPARWRLLSHLSSSLESQKEWGFEESDIDDLRRLIADTNITLLAITILASGLHLLFEFLTFKNEVSFWSNNTDLTGLSVRSLFMDFVGQCIIILYLIEKDSSLLMTVPAACGCAIALWKCHRGAGFAIQRQSDCRSYVMMRLGFGYCLVATRFAVDQNQGNDDKKEKKNQEKNDDKKNKKSDGKTPSSNKKTTTTATKSKTTSRRELVALTMEMDRLATRRLGSILLPLVLIYTVYSLVMEYHAGWYSWLITCASSAVYALGFCLMTPQLFLNYKLKSVAHLPWRVLVYKFLNTFIDDLFAFIIRMPTMARLSCFRDDVVFIIYLYQRWLYPVDTSRPVEGGDGSDLVVGEKEKTE